LTVGPDAGAGTQTLLTLINANTTYATGLGPRVAFQVGTGTSLGSLSYLMAGSSFSDGSRVNISNRDGSAGYFDLVVNGSERLRVDSSGRLLVGTSTSSGSNHLLQVRSDGGTNAEFFTASVSANIGPYVNFSRSKGSAGSPTVVANNDRLGTLFFNGYSGAASAYRPAAEISAFVDGEPDTSGDTTDMPGRLVFSTTADGASSPTERFRITNDGVIAHDQPAPAAVNATATLTVANLKTGIITSTSALATDMTLPTGTDTQAGFSGSYDNFTFEWSVINTGPSLVRVLAGTAHTIVGSGSVATGTSGRFASRRTATNTFVTYRLS
jgi:hypothetical protein